MTARESLLLLAGTALAGLAHAQVPVFPAGYTGYQSNPPVSVAWRPCEPKRTSIWSERDELKGPIEDRLGISHAPEELHAFPVFRVVAESTWMGRYTPERERESSLSIYLPTTGDAIVELATAKGQTDGLDQNRIKSEQEYVTLARVSLDRSIGRNIEVRAAQNVRTSVTTKKPGWTAIHVDAVTHYTVLRGVERLGETCAQADVDLEGCEFNAEWAGSIAMVLRQLARREIDRQRAEALLRAMLIAAPRPVQCSVGLNIRP